MTLWFLAVIAGVLAAWIQYGRASLTPRLLGAALLRFVSAAVIVALLLGAPAGRAASPQVDVALDASESWLRASDSSAWHAALDSAQRIGGSRVQRFGDTLRIDATRAAPTDHASRLRDVVDAAAGSGRPVVVITDGEVEEGELLAGLPRGSRALVIPRREGADVALSSIAAPRALLAGDTVQVQVTLAVGSIALPGGTLELRLDDVRLDTVHVPALAPYAERTVAMRGVVAAGGPARGDRSAVLRAIVRALGDREPRNDTIAVAVDVTRAPAAVFVSTAPDYDAREAVAALRGVTSLPTRAFYRVAPGMWRVDGTLASVEEKIVREAVRDAPVVVLHGDTAMFGAPRAASRGALLLFAPPAADDGEWFASAAPVSPLAAALAGIPFDSLPPLSVAPSLPRGEWEALVTRRGGSVDERRVALVGWETPRRVVVLGASGFWRWRFRGGIRADAFAALFGTVYDWLAAGRSDQRAVLPDGGVVRAGTAVRWRRGAATDSTVGVLLVRRGAPMRAVPMTLRFAHGASLTETPSLPSGIYDVRVQGGVSVLVVNPSRELVPRRSTITSGAVGGEPALGDAPRLRERGWAYALVILLLCAEWLLRRRVGLR